MLRGKRHDIDERRHSPRLPVDVEVRGSVLSPLEVVQENHVPLLGKAENIAKGGICVISAHAVPTNSLVRCELMLAGSSVGIPSLAQVRWVENSVETNGYRLGLQFLL